MDNNKRLAVADIVDRLRFPLTGSSWLKLSAAAEIERLRAENERLMAENGQLQEENGRLRASGDALAFENLRVLAKAKLIADIPATQDRAQFAADTMARIAELAQVLERAQSHIGVLRAAIDEKTREVEYEQRRRQQTAEDKAKLFATANDLAEENVALRAQVERAVALLGNDGGGSYMRIRQIIRAGRTRGGLAVSKRRRKTSEVKPNR